MTLKRWVIATGNAFEGTSLVGFFHDADEAAMYAEQYCNPCTDWNLVELEEREDLKDPPKCISCDGTDRPIMANGECTICIEPPEVTAEEVALRNLK